MNKKQRQENHEAAQALWDACNRTNRVSGLGERLRDERRAARTPSRPGQRAAEQLALRKSQADTHADALRVEHYREPVPRYFPHQSDREMARRVRQMASREQH